MMYARKVKKICSVRGCRNTESFAIAKTKSEIGNVIICASCLAEALSSVDECRAEYDKKVKKLASSAPAALFYHPELKEKASDVVSEVKEEAEEMADEIAPEAEEIAADGEKEASGEDIKEATEEAVDDMTVGEDIILPQETITQAEAVSFICPECGKVFSSEKSLKAHVARAHKE